MSIISIRAGAFVGVRTLGGGEPEDGYYKVRFTNIQLAKDKADTFQLTARFPSGYEKFVFLHGFDPNLIKNGSAEEKRKHGGRAAAMRSVLEALGIDGTVIETHEVNDAWFLYSEANVREACVGWCAGEKGVKDAYGDIVEWVKPSEFDAKVASGTLPNRAGLQRNGAGAGTPAPSPGGPSAFTPPPPPAGGPPGAGFAPPPGGAFAPPPAAQGSPPPGFTPPPAAGFAPPPAPSGPPAGFSPPPPPPAAPPGPPPR